MLVGRPPPPQLLQSVVEASSAEIARVLGNRASMPYKREAIKGVIGRLEGCFLVALGAGPAKHVHRGRVWERCYRRRDPGHGEGARGDRLDYRDRPEERRGGRRNVGQARRAGQGARRSHSTPPISSGPAWSMARRFVPRTPGPWSRASMPSQALAVPGVLAVLHGGRYSRTQSGGRSGGEGSAGAGGGRGHPPRRSRCSGRGRDQRGRGRGRTAGGGGATSRSRRSPTPNRAWRRTRRSCIPRATSAIRCTSSAAISRRRRRPPTWW